MRGWQFVLVAACALGGALSSPGRVSAFGPDGHAIVGKVAAQLLTKKARESIKALLAGHKYTGLEDERLPNWADAVKHLNYYKDRFPNNDKWHYINLDVAAAVNDATLDGLKDGDNVLMAIPKFQATLKKGTATQEERREALFFLAHFLGDISQPLHCADRAKDNGGNLQRVQLPSHSFHATNLHGVWDGDLVHEAMGGLTVDDYANRLVLKLSKEKRKEYEEGDVRKWILEGYDLAKKKAYKDDMGNDLPPKNKTAKLTAKYMKDRAELVEEQLTKGGVRLAKVLNNIFGD